MFVDLAKQGVGYQLLMISSLLLTNINSYGQLNISLQQCIDSTLTHNLQTKQALLNEALSIENLKQSRYNLLPVISTSPEVSNNWGRSLDVSSYNYINQGVFLFNGSIGLQVGLFQGGQLRNQILQNKILLEADRTNTTKIKNDLTLSVVTTFLQVIATEDLLKAAKQQVQVAKLNLERIQKSFNVGTKSLADLAQAKAQLAITELDEVNIQTQLDSSLISLKQLMEVNPATDLQLVKPNISKLTNLKVSYNAQSVLTQALLVNPDIELANLKKDAIYQGIKVAKSSFYPSLYLFGSLGSNFSSARTLFGGTKQTGYDTIGFVDGSKQKVLAPSYNTRVQNYSFNRQIKDNFYQSLGLTLQIPILNHLSNQINFRKAKINYRTAQVMVSIAQKNLDRIINQALADLKSAERRLNATESNYQATKETLYVGEKRYQVGLINTLDYTIALTNFNKAEFNLIQAQYDLVFRNKIIDYYLGKPLQLEN